MSDENKLARPYAKAVFELAQRENTFDNWSRALGLAKEAANHPSLAAMISNPTIAQSRAIGVFEEIGGQHFDDNMHRLLELLAKNKRLFVLPAIFELFEQMRKAEQKIVDVTITTAYPLKESMRTQLSSALEKRFSKKVNLDCQVDKKILGGAIVRSGDWVLDGSIMGRLANLHNAIGIA